MFVMLAILSFWPGLALFLPHLASK